MSEEKRNEALEAESEYRTTVEEAYDYVENFDILETITNVGNDEVFTPRKTADMMLDSLPEEVWHNPNYRWLNPATKNGIFEREIAIRLDRGLAEVMPDIEARRKHILQNMIFSFGQTRFTANVARRTVYYCSQANRACDGIKAPDGHYVNGYAIGNGTWFEDEEGNIKTPCTDHEYVDGSGKPMPSSCTGDARKKYRCKHCGISGDSKYNDANQREKYAYEFIHVNHLVLKKFLQDRFFRGNRNMKFDIVIGNPPYQLNDGGGVGSSAMPIYNKFVEQAIALNPRYLCMIIPSRWFSGGRGLDSFRDSMLHDERISLIHDFYDPAECFPTVEIKGGVCYFLWDREHKGDCVIVSHKSSQDIETSTRPLLEKGLSTFIRDGSLIPVMKKVDKVVTSYFSQIVSANDPYGFDTREDGSYKRIKPQYKKESFPGSVQFYYNGWRKEGIGFFPKKDVTKGAALIDTYRIFIPKAWGTGDRKNDWLNGFIVEPGSVSTETYLTVGPFKNRAEAENCLSYIHTKFFHAMVSLLKITQNSMQIIYTKVPLVDFAHPWNDQLLYERFNLSQQEIAYIEQNIAVAGSAISGEDQ